MDIYIIYLYITEVFRAGALGPYTGTHGGTPPFLMFLFLLAFQVVFRNAFCGFCPHLDVLWEPRGYFLRLFGSLWGFAGWHSLSSQKLLYEVRDVSGQRLFVYFSRC